MSRRVSNAVAVVAIAAVAALGAAPGVAAASGPEGVPGARAVEVLDPYGSGLLDPAYLLCFLRSLSGGGVHCPWG
ncbi:hypothetical protein HLB23_16205 [Nocardia uniformis]|uniref:Secreted protein n=1 Tax=Nocardia uniformis TaxID=53432 RepID=A0A849C163_9NOCA|nr:hypothetical protein [Nocardia uniformis]NNH71388.1 hypothetical protein [Nocardia uniformis]